MMESSHFPVVVNSEFAERIREEHLTWLILEVGEPVTITTREQKTRPTTVTYYLVRIETSHSAFVHTFSAVRRRYSEFVWLRTILAQNYPKEILPPIPPKTIFQLMKFNPKVIEERCTGLSLFLQKVLQKPVFLSDPFLHLFLQTDMAIEDIERKIAVQNLRSETFTRQNSCSSSGSASSSEMSTEEIKD